MMRTVVVATVLATLASVAATTLYLNIRLDEAEANAYAAKFKATTAEQQAERAVKFTAEMGAVIAMQPSAESIGAMQAKLDGMRQELDEMQTQIRLLKLMAR